MSYERVSEYRDGNTLMACSICGVRYVFPDEVRKSSDGLFRCLRTCDERPIRDRDKLIAQSHKRREVPPPKFGVNASYEPTTAGMSLGGGLATGSPTSTLNIPSGSFDASYLFHRVTLAGTSSNDGTYTITSIVDVHTFKVAEPTLSNEAFIGGTATFLT